MGTPNPIPGNVPFDPSILPDTGRIVIRLEQTQQSDSTDLLQLARELGYVNLEAFLNSNPQITAEPVIQHIPPRVIREREAIAARGEYPPVKSLASYWRLDVRSSNDDLVALRTRLQAMPEIELAYHETTVIDAAGLSVAANTYESHQHVLDAAPQGIDARSAWNKPNGLGQNVSVIDLESGWISDHQDLPKFAVLHGDNRVDNGTSPGDHGAAVLSIIGALNNDVGIVGIATALQSLDVVSHYHAKTDSELHVAEAIDAAAMFLQPGDILALEVQRPQGGKAYPVEIDSADLQAIRLACTQGIIVIEAAGNWYDNNLDAWPDPNNEHSFNPASPLYSDSGAIMVGASNFSVVSDPAGFDGHERYYRSNYGQRVNCYALGEQNYSAGYANLSGSLGSSNSYTNNFSETSAATAVIAGAAALVQSWYKSACGGQPLTPAQMRAILSDPATGTKQANIKQDPIGVMPNLNAIMACPMRFRQILLCRLRRIARRPILDVGEFEAYKYRR